MAKSLHEQAAEYIRARIQSGEYALGSRIPTEKELCALLGVSRPTLRQALDTLTREGVLSRVKGRGTFVTQPKVTHESTSFITGYRAESERNHHTVRTKVLEIGVIRAPEEICAALRKQGYVKDRVLTGSFFADRDRGAVRLGGSLQDLSAAVAQVLSGVYTPRAIPAENAHGGNVTARADPEKLQTEAFRSLWARVGPKSFYTVSFDTRELIGNVIGRSPVTRRFLWRYHTQLKTFPRIRMFPHR